MYGKDFEAELERIESRYPPEQARAALIEALHAVQDRKGYVPDEAIHWLAARYHTSAADVSGVISFYVMFFTKHPGKHVIWLCRTFPCELLGAREVMAALERKLGCKVGETDPSGTFHLRWLECLAACDTAPCALIDKDMYGNLTPEAIDLVIDHVKRGGGGGVIRRRPSGEAELIPTPAPVVEA
jgi:NADH-quinone oxidoreductase subunit E